MKISEQPTQEFTANQNHKRIDLFLAAVMSQYSRGDIQKYIKLGLIKLNGKVVLKKNITIKSGDQVIVTLPGPKNTASQYQPRQTLKRLYEDDYLLIIDKPPNISVHKGITNKEEETIQDIFSFYYPLEKGKKDDQRAGIIHRLDKETTGVLILAKDERTGLLMQAKFKKREVTKTYLAILQGNLRFISGKVAKPIKRSRRNRTMYTVGEQGEQGAKDALSFYQCLLQVENYCWVRLSPHTGRTHQLRVHMKWLGNPVLGDRKYGKKGDSFERLALHAYSIQFEHPVLMQRIMVYSAFPKIFRDFLKARLR